MWVSNPGRFHLEQYNSDGRLVSSWGRGMAQAGGLNSGGGLVQTDVASFLGCCNPADFVRLPDGRFITGEKGMARVKMFKADGTFEGVVAPPQAFSGNISGLALAADGADRVYVLERGTADIRIFTPKAPTTAVADGGTASK